MIYQVLLQKNKKLVQDEIHKWGERLLSYGLYKETGIIYKSETVIRNKWGKPFLKNHPSINYNISHCENYIVCVISHSHVVGIDVERIRNFNIYAAKRICSKEELEHIYHSKNPNRDFFKYWTLKESAVKAMGVGISYPMKDVQFFIKDSGEIGCNLNNLNFKVLDGRDEFIVSVCYKELYSI